jgi:iron complex outermembrane recepter protein
MFRFFLAAGWSLFCVAANAQYTLSGSVTDATKQGLPLASVQLSGRSGYAVTDDAGHYELKGVQAGEYILRIKFVGFMEKVDSISVHGNLVWDVILMATSQITDEVVVTATRANDRSPTTYSTLSKVAIQKQNFGQDLPFILNWTPSLVTTSDAGAGVGYTGLRIRGSDATRINVTFNGIPFNDAESQGVYWVDVPDIATSSQSIQIQRGVGTSTNGAGAFGASINLQTTTRNDKPYADLINSFGSFNTERHTAGFGTGLINDKFVFDARASLIKSDGFIDRASSDLKSFYLSGAYYGKKTMVKAIIFGGQETTYQAWYGVPESRLKNDTAAMRVTAQAEGWNAAQFQNLLNSNSRTFNIYTYKNQVDNYAQDNYQLHFSHKFNSHLLANAALHYTYGRGYYEEYRYNDSFSNYGIPNAVIGSDTIKSSDLVRRLWLNNNFYGTTYSVKYDKDKWSSLLGGGWNHYSGDHYGEVTWAQIAVNIPTDYRYYFNNGSKYDFNIFWKNNYQVTEKLNGFADVQLRQVKYHAAGTEDTAFDFRVKYNFFNPKVGFTYELASNDQLYASYCIGNREPIRDDFVQALAGQQPKHETLRDLEAGWRIKRAAFALNINYYYMDYKNQLVLTGKLNDVGASIRTNVPNSYRQGIEIDGGIRLAPKFTWNANVTFSQNKIQQFTEVLYDYGVNYDQNNVINKVHKNTDISFSPNVIAGSSFSYSPILPFQVTLLTKYVGRQFLDNTSDANRQINAYFTNDVRMSYTWKPAVMREISISLLLNNIMNIKYSSNGYTYGYFGGGSEIRQNYYYPQAGRNFLAMLIFRF